MTKRKQHISWLGWMIIVLAAIFLLGAAVAVISMFFPYAPSQGAQQFCRYVLPPILFLLLFAPAVLSNLQARRVGKPFYRGNWLVPLFCGALVCIGWSLIVDMVPAIPARFFARKTVTIPVIIDSLEGFRLNHDYWTWVYFDRDDKISRFMWTRSDPLLSTLKHGDCILLHAREWPAGIYVDSISRSTACKDQN